MTHNSKKIGVGNDALKLTGSKIITMVITLVSSMLLSRFRTLTEYGTYSQLLMAINLVCSMLMLGLPNSINYFLARAETPEEKDKFLSVYYTLNTILSFIVGLVLVLATPLLELFFKNEWIRSFWYFLAFFPWTRIVMSSVEHLLIVYRKTGVLMAFRVANSVALLGIILFVQLIGGTFATYMVFYLITEVVFTLWTYALVKRNTSHLHISFDKSLIKTIFSYSIPIGLGSMVGTLKIEFDKIVITSFMATEDLAVYTNASKELPITIVSTSISAVLLPKVVRLLKNDENAKAIALWKSAITLSFSIFSVIAIGCFAFSEEVLTILYSEKYLGGSNVFRVYCIVLLCRCAYFGFVLNATGNTKPILYSSIGSLIVNVVLNYLLFFSIGFIGPAIATLIATLWMIFVQLIFSCKVTKIRFSNILPWKNIGIFLGENICLGLVLCFAKDVIVSRVFDNSVLTAIALGIVWTVAFFSINYRKLKKEWRSLNEEG